MTYTLRIYRRRFLRPAKLEHTIGLPRFEDALTQFRVQTYLSDDHHLFFTVTGEYAR